MRTTIKIAAQRGDAVRREAEIRRRASWEHGTNEHINGLFRCYLHRGADFSKISDVQIAEIESLINNRIRGDRYVFIQCSRILCKGRDIHVSDNPLLNYISRYIYGKTLECKTEKDYTKHLS